MPRFSETVMDHFQVPRNWGELESADAVGAFGVPGQGRYLLLQIRVAGDRITEAKFHCNGCGATIAAGSILTEMIMDRPVEECRSITAEHIANALDGLPPDKMHCATFAAEALQQSLANC